MTPDNIPPLRSASTIRSGQQHPESIESVPIEKALQAADILKEFNTDLWLTFVRETSAVNDPVLPLIYGETGLTWHSALIFTKSGERIAIVGRLEAAEAAKTGVYPTVIPYDESIRPVLCEVMARLDPKNIAINTSVNDVLADGLSHGMYQTLVDILSGTPYGDRLQSAEQIISALRGRKTPGEITRIKAAIRETQEIYAHTLEFVHDGMSEKQVANFMHNELKVRDLQPAWSADGCPIVNAGPESPIGHSTPGELQVRRGLLLHLDFGVQKDGYCSDIQRLFYFLAPGETQPPAEVQRAFDTVVEAIRTVVAALKPGMTGKEVDDLARSTITRAGYPEYKYATGHQLGRLAHDGGALLGPAWERYGNTPHRLLEAGQVYTVEPGIFLDKYGYVGIEEDVLVTENGAEFLSEPQASLWTE